VATASDRILRSVRERQKTVFARFIARQAVAVATRNVLSAIFAVVGGPTLLAIIVSGALAWLSGLRSPVVLLAIAIGFGLVICIVASVILLSAVRGHQRTALAEEAAEAPFSKAETPDPAQLRRAIDRASAQLRKQRPLVWEWRLHAFLDPHERGEWETEDRKGILHQDPRFRDAYHATEDAFNAISLMVDPTNYHREQAVKKIDVALSELDSAWKMLTGLSPNLHEDEPGRGQNERVA